MRKSLLYNALMLVVLSGCDQIPGTSANKISVGQEAAAEVLIDPSSAMFRNSAVFDFETPEGETTYVVCGEINGKNRNGAYVGYSRFVAAPEIEDGIVLEPIPFYGDEQAIELGEQCEREAERARRNRYGSISAQYTCERALEAAEERQNRLYFEGYWSNCSLGDDEVHLPNLVYSPAFADDNDGDD